MLYFIDNIDCITELMNFSCKRGKLELDGKSCVMDPIKMGGHTLFII